MTYHVKSYYRYDGSEYATYDEAEKAAKIGAVGGYEKIISQEVARVVPDTTTSVLVVKS